MRGWVRAAISVSTSPAPGATPSLLNAYGAARTDIADYRSWYNGARAYSSLGDLTPDERCFASLPAQALAA